MIKNIIILISMLFLISCGSTTKLYDDALEIKYTEYKEASESDSSLIEQFNPDLVPGIDLKRNPTTLRGHIYHIAEIESKNDLDSIETNKYVVFLDKDNFENDELVEYVPIEYTNLLNPNPDTLEYWVAQYNSPDLHTAIRQLDTKYIDISSCGCKDPSLPNYNLNADLSLSCPFVWEKRLDGRRRIFAEVNGGISIYDNFDQGLRRDIGINDLSGEFIVGWRFGNYQKKHFGLGISYFTGANQFSRSSGENIRRDALLLHGKYTFDIIHKYICMFPYIYGQLGMAIDVNSLYVGRLGLSQDLSGLLGYECECESDGEADFEYRNQQVLDSPEADFDIPISFGLGAGVEMSLHKYLDLSIDLNYKYVQYGERINLFGLDAPKIEDMSVFSLRMGLHF